MKNHSIPRLDIFFQNKEDSEVSQTQILKKSRIYENQQNIDKNRAEET